nr:DNA repair protein RadC [Govania unica]
MKERFFDKGPDSLKDYELLELLLCVAIPRRDLKPLAKDLIRRFGSFSAVLSAPRDRLREIPGVGETVLLALKVSQASAIALQREDILNQPVISSWKALIGYCRSVMAHEQNEQFRVLFLDKKNTLMMDELQSSGTVDQTSIYPREVIKRALELGATALILVHNHPSGDPTPSREDIEMTRELKGAAEKLGINVHDHLVIARNSHVSFKTLGLL